MQQRATPASVPQIQAQVRQAATSLEIVCNDGSLVLLDDTQLPAFIELAIASLKQEGIELALAA